jgi:non-ribosomal peptide synthetase-like protein
MSLLRGEFSPAPRTLVEVFRASVAEHADSPALDNGAVVLTYEEFAEEAQDVAASLAGLGIGAGDTVGIRIASGTTDLYVAIMGTLLSGAAYVPVDADDPDERARTVFAEAGRGGVAAVIGNDLTITPRRAGADPIVTAAIEAGPTTDDDAWVIFTSGSTGTPKGVAVTHRNAAAFVDAEARLFLQHAPIGPGDRVMAGLSVAFDASCEEMWLAWRYGAALVPAPRSLVRSGMDLGPWLVANDITIVSTVPTLVALWPADALADVRLLILGGEACPPELAARLATPGREVWNTYGPTEATVVACAARLTGEPPVRIGLPLDGWDLAVVNGDGQHVAEGEVGELVIGGVGLARYLDPAKDAEKYAPMPSLGWQRAYRSGDLVRYQDEGLLFMGRADDQVKVGGRRIELGEIDSALLALPGVSAAAAAVRRTGSGNAILIGYVTPDPAAQTAFDPTSSLEILRRDLPAALVPRLAVVEDLPTRTSGKIDRDALPWPLAGADEEGPDLDLPGTQARIRADWAEVLGARVSSADDDFFDLGGGSLTAAQMVSRLRTTHPEITVADIYDHPTLAALARYLDEMAAPTSRLNTDVPPVPLKTQVGQVVATWPLRTLSGLRWLTWLAAGADLTAAIGAPGLAWVPTVSWWWVALGWAILILPPGRMLAGALGARLILRGIGPGSYPRGGRVHLRMWLAERLADELGTANLSGAVLMRWYARLLGAHVGRDVDLHTIPPVTGLLHLGAGCAIEPEVDLTGYWVDGSRLQIGAVHVGPRSRVGARSTLTPGAHVGADAEIAPGSAVFGTVPDGEYWSGAPAQRIGPARGPYHDTRPDNRARWLVAYTATSVLLAGLPVPAVLAGVAVAWPALRATQGRADAVRAALIWLPAGTVLAVAVLTVSVWAAVRLLGVGLAPGVHPVQGRVAWQAWSTVRVLDEARTWLFPLYSSTLTPTWLRALGARIGPDVEASTVLMIPKLTSVAEGAFLADDTLIGGYELGGGWLRVEPVKVGKHAFVGNSGMAAPGRKVPKRGLVAVLSAAPHRTAAKAGTSWIGSPPALLRRTAARTDQTRTYHPPQRMRVARAAVEACRLVPLMLHVMLVVAVVAVLLALAERAGWWAAALASGAVLMAVGAVAAGLATAAKWLLVGRVTRSDHPLWSSFVWRNELADTFVEVLAAPWFARAATGTSVLNAWLRTMGARIGRGVWCETYWLPEADLIDLRDGVTVNRGCVVQTHLFHDRVLSMDTVTMRAGSTLGPNGVILPAATIGRHATIGPVSLVMRGESVPDKTRWIGNPIGPWVG